MPALPGLAPPPPPLAALTARQSRGGDSFTVIPSEYGALYGSPSPGVVAGIVLGSVAGFLLFLAAIYTCLNGFPGAAGVASDGVSTYVSRTTADNDRSRSRRRPRRAGGDAEMYEVHTRTRTTTTNTRGRPAPDIVDTPTASAFEPSRRGPSAHRGPPPRVVRDSDDSESEDEVVVIEEHSPPRRKNRRPSPSYLSDDRSRRDSSYRDAESDLYSYTRR
jgi:hypothetical protein